MNIDIFVVLIIFFIGWEVFWYFLGVQPMYPWKLRKNLDRIKKEAALVDVRTAAEYKLFHIDGAVHLPEILVYPEAAKNLDPDKPVIVICMTGHRSPIAGYKLKKHGLKEVYSLTWGMLAWKLTKII